MDSLSEECRELFMMLSTPCGVKGKQAWDAELNMADYDNYMSKDMLNIKMVKDVRVRIHGYDVQADFVVVGYVNKREPSIAFRRSVLVTTKSQVNFDLGEMRIDITMLKEDNVIDTLLANLIENMVEVGYTGGGLVKMGHCLKIFVASYVTVVVSCQNSTQFVRKYCVSDLSSCASSELGSELTFLAGSELDLASYRQRVTDIQCGGFDTRPPMLDRTDFASVKQCVRLYCRGKENGVNILKSIDEGPFQMGTFRVTIAEGNEDALHLVPEQPRVYSDLTPEEKERVDRIEDRETMHGVQVQLVMGELRTKLGMLNQENMVALDEEQLLFIAGGQDNAVDEDVDEQPAPDAKTMFMANISYANLVYDEACPSYDLDILSEQVQHALYNGHEIIKTNHVPAIMHNIEDTLEIAEMTMKKMNDKMKEPECVNHKVKIAPPDYSKENYLATFTPQKQLTSEQIFWSQDLNKMKAEALKKQATASRPIKALTVYPPNTPTTLVPKFEKTCKKRITPTGLTEGERGFEQTKECYLTEVILFFETLKEHFKGIQKALTKKIKEMKDIFQELEAEVDQNIVHRKHDEIERKNLLIANDNLISGCLSEDMFYIATYSELTVSRFTKMQDAYTFVQARCLELEAELSNLHTRSEAYRTLDLRALDFQIIQLTKKVNILQEQNRLFRAENEIVKQHYKELYDSLKLTRAKHIEQTTALLTENENLKVQLLNKMTCVTKDHVSPKVLVPSKYAIDVEPIPLRIRNNREVHLDYLKHLKEHVGTVHEIIEEAKFARPFDRSFAYACHYTKHSQKLLEYAIGTCLKDFHI
uniref:Integrase, catalytic region, zinc finger, CCHC-type, peptidase aspartic, catalytic n=1 Tax=Tanacetum cinerariifolium TaxID=118510 RepID=A0A699GS93_TANCI|nr:hypothetical protein [Tanacetum cinerariifolium]